MKWENAGNVQTTVNKAGMIICTCFRQCSGGAGTHYIQPEFPWEPRPWRIPVCESNIPVYTEVCYAPTPLPLCHLTAEMGDSLGESVPNKTDAEVRC